MVQLSQEMLQLIKLYVCKYCTFKVCYLSACVLCMVIVRINYGCCFHISGAFCVNIYCKLIISIGRLFCIKT